MTERQFDPSRALGEQIAELDNLALLDLVVALCSRMEEECETTAYHGGVFPDNISRSEDGSLALGPGRLSDWDGQELQYIAPELYWDGTASPAADVYSLGLLLYYGVSGGKLPLEGESPNPQLSRMSGAAFSVPASAGLRLREIIKKALSFQASDRYESVRELRIMLESCRENKYLGDNAGETLFRKEEVALSEIERMMLDIIDGKTESFPAAEKPVDDVPAEEVSPLPEMSEEEAAALILGASGPAEADPGEREAEMRVLVDEIFGEKPEESGGETEQTPPDDKAEEEPLLPVDDEPEDVRVYEPSREKKEHIPIPILTEEKNPELEPVVPKRTVHRYTEDEDRNREIERSVRKRRTRPFGVILILCGLLIFAALFANHFLQNYEWEDEGQGKTVELPEVSASAIPVTERFVTAEELRQQEEEATRHVYYQVFSGDLSWTDAKNACMELGGSLAVINSQDEFTMVTQLAQNSGVKGIWVGCHREGGFLQWETAEPTASMNWAQGEPSYTDNRDGAAEDYVMIWNTGTGWAYIDCRNDPVAADPNIYTGVIGYVCEFVN